MSAWAELVNHDGSDEFLELLSRAMLEVQTEQRRKDATKLRSWASGFGDNPPARVIQQVIDEGVRLIDPDA